MPKLDLVNALQIKSASGEVLQLKGPGFSWKKPTALTPFYRSGTIGIHLRSDGATPAGGPVTAIANEGGAGALFNASVVGNPIPLSGNFLQATTATGYPLTANPADLVGVRLMWVMRLNSATGTYRFFGRNEGSLTSYIRTLNGTSLQLNSNRTGTSVTVTTPNFTSTSAARMFELEVTNTEARLWINSALIGSVSHPWSAFMVDRLTQGPSTLQPFEGGMGDVLGVVTGRPDTASAITVVRSYLTQRFSL